MLIILIPENAKSFLKQIIILRKFEFCWLPIKSWGAGEEDSENLHNFSKVTKLISRMRVQVFQFRSLSDCCFLSLYTPLEHILWGHLQAKQIMLALGVLDFIFSMYRKIFLQIAENSTFIT